VLDTPLLVLTMCFSTADGIVIYVMYVLSFYLSLDPYYSSNICSRAPGSSTV